MPAATKSSSALPTVVLHFRGLPSGLSARVSSEDLWRFARKEVEQTVMATVALGACVVASQAAHVLMIAAVDGALSAMVTFATFSSCTILAQGVPNSKNVLTIEHSVTTKTTSSSVHKPQPPTLPLLAVRGALVPSTQTNDPAAHKAFKKKQAAEATPLPSSPSKLPLIRKRVLNHLKQAPPNVNVVASESRKRADMPLYNAKLRVGKSHMSAIPGLKKQYDIYMLRVDCTSGAADEKHMNPVVMWDVTATFDEFKRLELALKAEIKAKRLRNVTVPHLSSGAILFVQQELTDHVLNARRARLQTFMDAICKDQVLADLDATRKFCQAF